MPGLVPFAFLQPWLLVALIGLPALWFLLRVTPPAPKSLRFPAIRLLRGLEPPEETPARTPWWLLALRLLAAALIVLGLAGPTLHPAGQLSGSGPLVLVIDDGWAAGKDWNDRMAAAEAMLDRAARDDRRVQLLTTAPDRADAPLTASDLLRPDAARERIRALQPKPWAPDYAAAAEVARALDVTGSAHVVWLADGLAPALPPSHGTAGDMATVRALATALQRLGRLDVMRPGAGGTALAVDPPDSGAGAGDGLQVPVRRAGGAGRLNATVLAEDGQGRFVGSTQVTFEAGAKRATAQLDLPLQLRNRVAQVRIEGERHAGAVALLDERWLRRPVGLVSEGSGDAQPLLSELYYLERALRPYAEVSRGALDRLLGSDLAVIALPDRGALPAERRAAVRDWVARGGVLLRFAGPRLAGDLTGRQAAEGGGQPVLPVQLRRGGRALGGAMSWDSPATLADLPEDSPFAGLQVPDDLQVARQVLAQPSLELGNKTWARLTDGTPLVTAEQQGDGWIVLVHTTANTAWSNLPLSGLFVQMLRRIAAVGEGVAPGTDAGPLAPQRTLDGFGRLAAPPAQAKAIPGAALRDNRISPTHPPGYYGREGQRRAHNLGPALIALAPMADFPGGVQVSGYGTQPETPLGPWLIAAALVLILIDLAIALWLRGLLDPWLRRGAGAGAGAAALLLALALPAGDARAQGADGDPERYALQATTETTLAYVETGVARVDRVARQGLRGLSRVLRQRTSVEPGEPMAVDLQRHPLSLFPFLYWPVTPEQGALGRQARDKINGYLANGGVILFDLREPESGGTLFGQPGAQTRALQVITRGLEIPPLQPVPPEHVLTKAFYLLSRFPGRYEGGQLWVEDTARSGVSGDSVAGVLVGSNDYAGAWAIDESGRPRFAATPGGERQRELAYRVGVNVVMYALTGNYKADQVHVPAILERLGQ
jgi:hypothetical protein